ncbi:MAG: hypothetical protein WKG00_26290 [Polyangiaceae bacterium]
MAEAATSTGAPVGGARQRAEESVSTSFSRLMRATTSRWGMLTDPPVVAVATAVPVVVVLVARRYGVEGAALWVLQLVAALPVAAGLLFTLALLGARGRVIEWLAAVPFPVENLNAVLNGLGETLEVTFAGEVPSTERLNADLDKVHSDAFVTESAPAEHRVELRIGVVDSKRNPARSNHQRYARVRAIVDQALVPLSAAFPIREVRIK